MQMYFSHDNISTVLEKKLLMTKNNEAHFGHILYECHKEYIWNIFLVDYNLNNL